jgi:predicted acyl esterase
LLSSRRPDAPAAARADALSFAIPPGSKWTQAYITEADGTKLHADILRPANLPASAKTPVIISIGPYFNHSGQTGPAGPVVARRTRRSAKRARPRASSTTSTAPS